MKIKIPSSLSTWSLILFLLASAASGFGVTAIIVDIELLEGVFALAAAVFFFLGM